MSFGWDTQVVLSSRNSTALTVDAGANRLYVVGAANNAPNNFIKVTRVNLSDFSVIDTVQSSDTQKQPGSCALDSANGFLYVTCLTFGWVLKIDLSSFTITGSVQVSTSNIPVETCVLDTINNLLYVTANNAGPLTLYKIDPTTMTVVDQFDLTASGTQSSGGGALIDPAAGFAWFTDDAGDVFRVNLSTFTTTNSVNLAAADTPEAVAYDGTYLYMAECDGLSTFSLFKLNATTLATATSASFNLTGVSPSAAAPGGNGLVYDTSAKKLYMRVMAVLSGDPDVIVEIDPTDLSQIAAIATGPDIGSGPSTTLYGPLAVYPAGGFGYVGGADTNNLNNHSDWLGRFTLDAAPNPVTGSVTGGYSVTQHLMSLLVFREAQRDRARARARKSAGLGSVLAPSAARASAAEATRVDSFGPRAADAVFVSNL